MLGRSTTGREDVEIAGSILIHSYVEARLYTEKIAKYDMNNGSEEELAELFETCTDKWERCGEICEKTEELAAILEKIEAQDGYTGVYPQTDSKEVSAGLNGLHGVYAVSVIFEGSPGEADNSVRYPAYRGVRKDSDEKHTYAEAFCLLCHLHQCSRLARAASYHQNIACAYRGSCCITDAEAFKPHLHTAHRKAPYKQPRSARSCKENSLRAEYRIYKALDILLIQRI